MCRALEGWVYVQELEPGCIAWLGEVSQRSGHDSSLEGFQGCEHRGLRLNMWGGIWRHDQEQRNDMEEGRTVRYELSEISPQPFHIVAMENWTIWIFNLTSCFICFIEVSLNMIIFCQLDLRHSEQSQTALWCRGKFLCVILLYNIMHRAVLGA